MMKAIICLVAFSNAPGNVATLEADKYGSDTNDILEGIYNDTQNLNEDGWLVAAEKNGNLFSVVEEKVNVSVSGHRSLRSLSCNDVIVIDDDGKYSFYKVTFDGFIQMGLVEATKYIASIKS